MHAQLLFGGMVHALFTNMKNTFLKDIPLVPLSALVFHIVVSILWMSGIIPPPTVIVDLLRGIYEQYGNLGLVIASFLEGIVYLGLYFPGSFIIALAVFFSDGKFISLFTISILVAITLTITSSINYFFGRYITFRKEVVTDNKRFSKGLLFSILHPNLLAFYFFNEGVHKNNPAKILFVPLLMIPYGLLFAYTLHIFSGPIKSQLDNPYLIGAIIFVWVIISFFIERKKIKNQNISY